MSEEIGLSRKDAQARGLSKYQGGPCKRGHQGIRYVGNKACTECTVSYGKEWKTANRASEIERHKAWREANAGYVKADKANYGSRRRAKRLGLEHGVLPSQLRTLLEWQDGKCAYCGKAGKLELDHKVPMSKGGAHSIDNVQWLCHWHNQDKRDTSDEDYRWIHGIPNPTPWE